MLFLRLILIFTYIIIYNGAILEQHVIQSFAEREVTPEKAHKIGIELAGRYTDHKHKCIIATYLCVITLFNTSLICIVPLKHYLYVRRIGLIISENQLSCIQREIKVTVLVIIEHIFPYVVSSISSLSKSSG